VSDCDSVDGFGKRVKLIDSTPAAAEVCRELVLLPADHNSYCRLGCVQRKDVALDILWSFKQVS